MGAWIEIIHSFKDIAHVIVAPLVGAWIEIACVIDCFAYPKVAPLVGAWIEIDIAKELDPESPSRSPRGSVD